MSSASIIFVIMASTFFLLEAGNRYFQSTNAAIEAHDQALSVTASLVRELREGSPQSFLVFAAPVGIVFGSARTPNGKFSYDSATQQLLWTKRICYYLESRSSIQVLVRKEESLATPQASPPTVDSSCSAAYFQAASLPERVVGRNISKFELQPGPPVRLTLATLKSAGGRDFGVTVETEVAMRN